MWGQRCRNSRRRLPVRLVKGNGSCLGVNEVVIAFSAKKGVRYSAVRRPRCPSPASSPSSSVKYSCSSLLFLRCRCGRAELPPCRSLPCTSSGGTGAGGGRAVRSQQQRRTARKHASPGLLTNAAAEIKHLHAGTQAKQAGRCMRCLSLSAPAHLVVPGLPPIIILLVIPRVLLLPPPAAPAALPLLLALPGRRRRCCCRSCAGHEHVGIKLHLGWMASTHASCRQCRGQVGRSAHVGHSCLRQHRQGRAARVCGHWCGC
jgi:hypothetical protein